MVRTYNVGTEVYGLLTATNDPEFLLPIKVIILEKYTHNNRVDYRVKIRDIFETDFEYIKEHLGNVRVHMTLRTSSQVARNSLITGTVLGNMNNKTELLTYLTDKPFFMESNYLTLDKESLKDLYCRFVKYIINYHYRRLFQLTSRSFLSTTPIFENQKDMFLKRVEKIGFGDLFQKFDMKVEL
jgi:hypothetical protein